MPDVTVMRGATGKLEGFGEKGRRAFQKFQRVVAEMEPGEMLAFAYRLPRSPKHHRFTMFKLRGLFDRQDRFDDFDQLIDWLKVGAGHVVFLPGRDGVLCAIPKSLAWAELDEQEFIEFMRAVNDFLWTDVAQAVLWPHLGTAWRHECIEGWHREFVAPARTPALVPAEFPEVVA